MNILNRLPLGLKLALAPGVCLILMIAMALAALWGTQRADTALHKITQDTTPRQLLALELEAAVLRSQSQTYQFLASTTGSFSEEQLTRLETTHAQDANALKALAQRFASGATDSGQAEEGQAIQGAADGYAKLILDVVDMAKDDVSFAATEMVKAEKAFQALSVDLAKLRSSRAEAANQAVTSAAAASTASNRIIVTVAAVSLLLAIALSWAMRHIIIRQVEHIAEASRRLRAGDLTQRDSMPGHDEISATSRALIETVGTLRATMQTIVDGTGQINTAINELASGNEDFSVRTERAAATLQKAATEMNDLSQRVGDSARSAADAARIASESQTEAELGGVAVQDVVNVMGEITVASKKIQEITSVIDGIAFQTNILALNAAVESARAGEHGRGFAVVAAEVRALSQRSARAASEIKQLIGSSVERVESGEARVQQAGAAMQGMVLRARDLSAMVQAIAGAAGEQSRGVDSVARSISELETATQQNAALVEQAAAAAGSVRSESSRLVSAVGTFKLA